MYINSASLVVACGQTAKLKDYRRSGKCKKPTSTLTRNDDNGMGAAEGIAQHSYVCTMFSPTQSLATSCFKNSLLKVQYARDADELCNFNHSLSLPGAFVSWQYTLFYFSITA
jgi:hypothetical protein